MEHIRVNSTTVVSIGYDPVREILEVQFRRGRYQYEGVPRGEYQLLMTAASKGRYLHYKVKGRYPYVRVG